MHFFPSFALVALSAVPATAFWRLPCASPVVVERADPIVNAGAVSGHLHTIMGGNAFDFNMDYATTQKSDCTSCQVHGDLSNYWTPTLYYKHQNGTFEQVKQTGGMLVYYLQRRGKDSEKLHAFPEGFRMVAGDPYKRSGGDDFPSQAISYNCLDYSGKNHHEETGGFPNYNCPSGLRSQVFFPACWDGKNLDSEDHKSHMAYPVSNYNNGACPDTHPVHMISIFYEIIWQTDKFADMWYGGTQPFVWSMGDPTGYGLHGDFLNGWDVNLLQRAVDGCTNDSGRVEDCHEFNLYTADEAGKCKKPSAIDEALNFVNALPGCNPISNGPDRAQKVATCPNTPIVGGGDNTPPNNGNAPPSGSSSIANPGLPIGTSSPTTLVKSTTKSPSRSTAAATYGSGAHSSKPSSYNQAGPSSAPGNFYPSQASSNPSSTSSSTSASAAAVSSNPASQPSYSTADLPAPASPSPSPEPTAYTSDSDSASNGHNHGHDTCKYKPATVTVTETTISTVVAHPHDKKARHINAHKMHMRSGRMGPAYI